MAALLGSSAGTASTASAGAGAGTAAGAGAAATPALAGMTSVEGATAAVPTASSGLGASTATPVAASTLSSPAASTVGANSSAGSPGILGGLFGKSSGSTSQPGQVSGPSASQAVPAPKPVQANGGGGFLGITPDTRQALFQQAVLTLAQPKGGTLQSELPRFAEGGELKPGESAVVGDAGPEVATNQGGKTVVTPMTKQLASFPPEQAPGFGTRLVEGLQDALIFAASLQNPAMFVNARAAAATQEQNLAKLGIEHPELLATSPGVARAASRTVGQQGAEAILRGPEAAERERFAGIGVVPPATEPRQGFAPGEREAAIQSARQQGFGVNISPKGTTLDIPAVQRKDMDVAQTYATFHGLVSQGVPPVVASQKIIEASAKTGALVPEPILKLSTADTDREVATALASAEADARARVEQTYASGTAFERERGSRLAQVDVPLTNEQIARAKVTNRFQARSDVQDMIARGEVQQDQAAQAVRSREAQLNAPLEAQEFFGSKLGGPEQPTPEAARVRLTQIDQGQRALDRLLKVTDPRFIGPGAGRFGTIKEFFGATGKGEAVLRSEIRSLRRAYRLAQTGQQASDAELARLYGELLNEKMGVTQFAESLRTIGREIADKHASEAASLEANNERVPPLFQSERIDKLLGTQAAPEPQAQGGQQGARGRAGVPPPQAQPQGGSQLPPGPKNRVSQTQAAREIGATLQGFRATLQEAVQNGEMSAEQAAKAYNRVEASGALPAQ